jgi:predicted transcriptional regulator
MSMQSPTDAEAFYSFLGNALQNGDRETPLSALVRKWQAEQDVEEIRQGLADMEAGLGIPLAEVAERIRKKYGISNP